MTLFSYRAIDNDGKEVQGTIDAPDRESAGRALEDLHLDVTKLAETSRARGEETHVAPPPQLKTTFVFEGQDAAGMVRKGTIQSDNKYEAFDKLRHEHGLTLTLLVPMGIRAPEHDVELDTWQRENDVPQPLPPTMTTSAAVPTSHTTTAPSALPKGAIIAPPSHPSGDARPPPHFTTIPENTSPTTIPLPQASAQNEPLTAPPVTLTAQRKYFPLSATLRLYAGWLLGWYGLFVALGYYSAERSLPFEIPFVQSFYVSPTIFTVTVAVFLFLLLSTIHTATGGKKASGIAWTVGGIVSFLAIRLAA